jgi:hypothetical protein
MNHQKQLSRIASGSRVWKWRAGKRTSPASGTRAPNRLGVKALVRCGLALGFFGATCTPAYSYDWWVDAKVTIYEPTYMPASIPFQINASAGTCSLGTFLTYVAQGATATDKQANISAVLATLMTAQARNATVRIYGNNAGCTVTNIWIF